MNNKIYNVTNRSSIQVGYSIPELNNLHRDYAPGETKKVSYEELEKLSYLPGGMYILNEYLMVQEVEALDKLNMKPEREYHLNNDEVITLLKVGSMDEFLDCLDFAPKGVIDIIKDAAVKLPLNDMQKREAILEKTGFNVTKAIENSKSDEPTVKETPKRRVVEEKDEPSKPARRTSESGLHKLGSNN